MNKFINAYIQQFISVGVLFNLVKLEQFTILNKTSTEILKKCVNKLIISNNSVAGSLKIIKINGDYQPG